MNSHGNAQREVELVRSFGFSAAHRYFDRKLSDQENREIYGSLYREKGFGHNFLAEAYFAGPVDPMTGMVVNLRLVDEWLKDVSKILDHRHLNELPAFADQAPTPERIAQFIFVEVQKRLESSLKQMKQNPLAEPTPNVRLARIRLYEGESLWVDYSNH